MKRRLCVALGLAAVVAWTPSPADPDTVIRSQGSGSMLKIARAWAEAYEDANADITVSVGGGGSTVGIAGLIYGTVDIANSSRPMRDKERRLIKKRGNKAKEHVVAHGALAVFIHRENPLESIRLAQLAEVFGKNGTIGAWADLGTEVPGCRSGKILPVGRQVNSGTYLYFRDTVLGDGRGFGPDVRKLHGPGDVLKAVTEDPCVIAYGAVIQATSDVRPACIIGEEGGPCVIPSLSTISDRSYPLARPTYMYTLAPPSDAVQRYLDWVLSDEGQCILQAQGCGPVRPLKCD